MIIKSANGKGYVIGEPAFRTLTSDDLTRLDDSFVNDMIDLMFLVNISYVSIIKPKYSKYKGRKWNAMENLKFRCYVEKLRRGFGT